MCSFLDITLNNLFYNILSHVIEKNIELSVSKTGSAWLLQFFDISLIMKR